MGNANSVQPPKVQKDRKEGRCNFTFHVAQIPKEVDNPQMEMAKRKKPNEHVTVIARAAGKLWSRMTPDQRKKYVDLANEEKKRRQERKRKRKRSSMHSK